MDEHQTNKSAVFSIQHSLENTELCVENTASLVTCVTNFELSKVAKMNNLLTRNALNQLKGREVLLPF